MSKRLHPTLAIISILFFAIALIGSMYRVDDSAINIKEKNVKSKVITLVSLLNDMTTDHKLDQMLSQTEENNSIQLTKFFENKLPHTDQSSLFIWKNNNLAFWHLGIYELYIEQVPQVSEVDLLNRNNKAYIKISHAPTSETLGVVFVIPLEDLQNPLYTKSDDPTKIDSLNIPGLQNYIAIGSTAKQEQFVHILYLFGYLFLLTFLLLLAHDLAKSYPPNMVIGILLALLLILRMVSMLYPLSHPLIHEMFQPNFLSDGIPGSMADWFINILTGFAFALFFYIHLPKSKKLPNRWKNHLYTVVAYLIFCLCAVVFCFYVRAIVENRLIHLDINIIENLTTGSLLLLAATFILLLSLFIISIRLFISIHEFDWPWLEKMGLFFVAVALSVSFLIWSDIQINIWLWIISLLIIMLLSDLFLDSSMQDFTWVSVWLLVISLFSTVLFFHFYKSELKDQSIKVLTQKISLPDQQLTEFIQYLKNDLPDNPITVKLLNQKINDALFEFPLLRSRYNFKIKSETTDPERKKDSDTSYYYNNRWPRSFSYILGKREQKLQLEATEIGTELSYSTRKQKYGSHKLYNIGDWTIYEDGRITNNESLFFPPHLDSLTSTAVRDSQFIRDNTIYTLVKRDNRAALGRQEFDGLLQPMSFFSFNFILSLLITSMLLLINRVIPFLPKELHSYFIENLSIRNKIQFSVLAILIAAFTMVGIVSANFYKRSYKETLESMVKEYYQKVKRTQFQGEEVIKVLEGIPGRFVLFDQEGKAIKQNNFVQYSRLPYPVVRKINLSQTLDRFDEIWPGALVLPFSLDSNKSVFLVYPELKAVPDGFYRFINLLLNAFVFLLLISSALSFSISNTIISPLTELGNKLKDFSLGKRNEPIPWNQPDELGTLIQSYNEMVEKLEQSAELLAHSEREVAWREMAKQVAHEIKNPLTPMKLSIQHMESRIREAEEAEAREIVKHVSRVLVEQIDNLSRIASEFSSFAKLPKPEYEEILLNDLVASVYDLFRTRSNIKFNLYVPIDELMVQADRTHLIRVMNNLVKNAVQSIPPDREGHIVIRLKEHNGHAIVMVEDNGKGIEDHLKEKVFFPNFTTKSSGTGLGLAICKNIIETFNGTIYFVKNNPEGTVFIFELPLVN